MIPRCVVVLVAAGLPSPVLRADLVTHAAALYGSGQLFGDERYGTGQASAHATGPGSFIGDAHAWADYGRIGGAARVEASFTVFPINRALAEAAFSDTLRIDGATGAGFVVYTYTLTGWAEGKEADAHLFIRHSPDLDEELAGEVTSSGTFDSLPHTIVFGRPFRAGLAMLVSAALGEGESGVAVADFSAGATLTGLRVFDDQMRPVSGWTIWSQSGTSYPVPAPAPALALALLLIRRRSRTTPARERTP